MTIPTTPPHGVRERKKQQTRDDIARVALELFAERGYEETTFDDIAAASPVSRRTIFSYYLTKEDILFHHEPRILIELERRLRDRSPGTSVVEALGDLLTAFEPDKNAALRKRIIGTDDSLRRSERARFGRMEKILTSAIAQDLGVSPDDLRPRLLAAASTAAFHVAHDDVITKIALDKRSDDAGTEAFGYILELLRSGIATLTSTSNAASAPTRSDTEEGHGPHP